MSDSYDNHDRRILEDADAGLVDRRIVVVRCPHRIGLAYQGAPAFGMEDDWLMRLPCPCNDRSEVVATVEPVEEGRDTQLAQVWRDGWITGNRWAFSDADANAIETNPYSVIPPANPESGV